MNVLRCGRRTCTSLLRFFAHDTRTDIGTVSGVPSEVFERKAARICPYSLEWSI